MDELTHAINKLKSGRARDTCGVVAEMIKFGGGPLHDAILLLFNDLILPNALPPESWK